MIQGNHHITMSVGPAQEDYDFHTRTLGLRSIKKTVLFDGTLPIYHLYYSNADGDPSSILTTFPFRQAGIRGRRGTNQVKIVNLSAPSDSLEYWADRLGAHGHAVERSEIAGTPRVLFAHPCGIPYSIVGVGDDARRPYAGSEVPVEHAIRGAHGVTVSVDDAGEMVEFLEAGLGARRVGSGGNAEAFEVGQGGGGRVVEVVEEPDLAPGTWKFGEGTVHHVAYDAVSADSQMELKLHIEGLGYTDVSDVKDRQYFHSCYVRSPSGALFELAVSVPESFAVDEDPDELGREFKLPPQVEDRRAELMAALGTLETGAPA
ncbi:MAG: VOC family protein [Solirubrobacteraceae bacterium]